MYMVVVGSARSNFFFKLRAKYETLIKHRIQNFRYLCIFCAPCGQVPQFASSRSGTVCCYLFKFKYCFQDVTLQMKIV